MHILYSEEADIRCNELPIHMWATTYSRRVALQVGALQALDRHSLENASMADLDVGVGCFRKLSSDRK